MPYHILKQRERDYYSNNLSILNISSYSAVIETCFEMLKFPQNERNYDAIIIINPQIFNIACSDVRSADPQFHFTIEF